MTLRIVLIAALLIASILAGWGTFHLTKPWVMGELAVVD